MKKSSIYVVSLIVLAGLTTSAVYAAATVVPFSPPYQLQDATNGNAVRLNIDSDGNVGIGTASPQEVIDISKSSPSIHMLDLGTSEGGIGFKTADSNLYITNEYGHAYGLGLVSQSIVLTSSGNVGIGTASPTQALDINGNIRLTGNIVSPNDICIGSC